MKELGIYIHMPFCKKKCNYCDFISYSNKNELVEKYIEKLKQEIIRESNLKDYEISTIYIGGGTPSYISSKYILEILELIKERFNINNTSEITIEVNPGTVTEEKLQDYINSGINRISIGLQTTDNSLLKSIGRIHSFEDFLETYNSAKKVGFKNINVDLMIGIPNQTLGNIDNALEKIINLKPQHISVYSLIVEEGTVIAKEIEEGKLKLPEEEMERKEYWFVKKKLEEAGYSHYEISNFSKLGYESKHNMNCWEQKEYIGLGVAAHSYINKVRYSNEEKIEEYISNNKHTVHEIQTKEMQEKEFMLLGLRKIGGIRISEFKNKFIENPIYVFKEELNKLAEEELIEIDIDTIKLTDKGIDLANLVWEEFI